MKRNGSPNLSEASDTEAARKRLKKKHGTSSNLASGVSTPNGPPSRPRSPAVAGTDAGTSRPNAAGPLKKPAASRGNELKRPRPGGAGSGSDGEGAASGGEMSDASRKKIKIRPGLAGSTSGSPGGSRATSPNRETGIVGQNGSKPATSSRKISQRPII